MASLEGFEIRLEEPSSTTYFPGQTVSGRVHTTSLFEDDFKVSGLSVTFLGRAMVRWTDTVTRQHTPPTFHHFVPLFKEVTRTKSSTYFRFHQDLTKSTKEFSTGENHYGFSFQIPPMDLPASHSSKFSTVEYVLEAKFENSRTSSPAKARKVIHIAPRIDLNIYPVLTTPAISQITKNYSTLCCIVGDINLQADIPWRGYCPGDTIPLTVEIENISFRDVKDVFVDLAQEVTSKVGTHNKVEHRTVVKAGLGSRIQSLQTQTWHLPMKIPSTAPPTDLGHCDFIKVEYSLEIKAKVSKSKKKLSLRLPITIGTVPINHQETAVTTKPSQELVTLQSADLWSATFKYRQSYSGMKSIVSNCPDIAHYRLLSTMSL